MRLSASPRPTGPYQLACCLSVTHKFGYLVSTTKQPPFLMKHRAPPVRSRDGGDPTIIFIPLDDKIGAPCLNLPKRKKKAHLSRYVNIKHIEPNH